MIEIVQSNSNVVISQRKYVLDILEEIGMLDCKPIDTHESKCQACTWTGRASMRYMEISMTSGETKLSHHHLIRHFLSCKCSSSVLTVTM